MRKLALAALLGLPLAAASPAFGGTIYATGFENPPFALGSLLVGQDGWTGAPPLKPQCGRHFE
ncbi:MAG: hypothetical protein L0Y60_15990 [Beijerinckiaceae bacterium]|nr:hypothetical protein [Beijerinckiaceae bacterium]